MYPVEVNREEGRRLIEQACYTGQVKEFERMVLRGKEDVDIRGTGTYSKESWKPPRPKA